MLCRSCGAELRLGAAVAEGLREQLLFFSKHKEGTKQVRLQSPCRSVILAL